MIFPFSLQKFLATKADGKAFLTGEKVTIKIIYNHTVKGDHAVMQLVQLRYKKGPGENREL